MLKQWSYLFYFACLLSFAGGCKSQQKERPASRPNILIVMSDNQSAGHVGIYGDSTVRTPNMDKVAGDGVRFTNAFCNSPSCTPSRAGFLTGQDIWRLEEGANLWSILPTKYPLYTDLLEASGYEIGFQGKGWGPGSFEANGRKRNPGGNPYETFGQFLKQKKLGAPWSYWISSHEPHRPYEVGIGAKSGIDPQKVKVPGYLPDAPDVRTDIADYYHSVEVFDKELGDALALLKQSGELENTIVVVCSDNGWQMPRGLANLYDFGTHVPLIISWPGKFKKAAVTSGLVTLNDLAPTFLQLAGVPVPAEMTAKSLLPVLDNNSKEPDTEREFVVLGRERHAFVRQHGMGYPGRAIRTKQYLYIRNYEPDRWAAGDPPLYGDIDPYMLNYPGPAKFYMIANKANPAVKNLFELGMGKRPAEELFDITSDPYELHNLAADPAYKNVKEKLAAQMQDYLVKTKDPRATGGDVSIWDKAPYFSDIDKRAHPSAEAIRQFKLDSVYDYIK
ncbi:sulfatase [Niabella sp.]|uniref:sulfatase family protein n=1 Tax=Niabella sp. TaxID=1962976 RepID=UPI0026068B2E|nr:sulfatase [Niabella sp.]